MKKVKNFDSKENNTSLENVKEGKVKKNKTKKEKKLKEVLQKVESDLTPKTEEANLELTKSDGADKTKKKKNKNKSGTQQIENNGEAQPKSSNNEGANKIEKKKNKNKSVTQQVESKVESAVVATNEGETCNSDKKSHKNKDKEKRLEHVSETPDEELIEPEVKKIDKRKSKKFKKQDNKLNNKVETPESSTNVVKKEKKLEKPANEKKEKKACENLGKSDKIVDSTTNKVLTKKEKKAQKRQLIKDEKLAERPTRDPAIEEATIFVGNLPVNTKRSQLVNLFKKVSPVNFIRFRSAGGKKLFKHKQRKAAGSLNAYIVLKNKEAAEKALSLNGTEFKKHHLRITLTAKSSLVNGMEEPKRTVFVGNLKYSATEESLREIFSSCGEIDYVRCIRDGDKGCKGVAYVCFKTPDAVGLALELNATVVDERPINVERFSVKKLGAKEAREAQAEKEEKSKKGAKQRLEGKKNKVGQKKVSKGDDDKKPKKSEFRGVKIESLKKKQKLKKKKSNDQMLQLAKKIAPKPKTE